MQTDVLTLPESMRRLRTDPVRLIPVPWFVPWIDGRPEFRMADGAKLSTAIHQNRCWVCGGRHAPGTVTHVVGPMCGVNRVIAEPPCHLECARYSARACPFLSKPHMSRRGHEEIAALGTAAGVMLTRNPGVTLLWTQEACRTFTDGKGGVLFRLSEPLALEAWAEGRAATKGEVLASVESGLPLLAGGTSDAAALAELRRMRDRFVDLLDQHLEA